MPRWIAPRRRDGNHWQRPRRHRRFNAAAILATVAALFGTLGVMTKLVDGTHNKSRAEPLYWLLMLPMVRWVSNLMRFSARAVRLWTLAMLPSSGGAAFGLLLAVAGGGELLVPLLDLSPAVPAAGAGLVLRRGSLVDREGPAR